MVNLSLYYYFYLKSNISGMGGMMGGQGMGMGGQGMGMGGNVFSSKATLQLVAKLP